MPNLYLMMTMPNLYLIAVPMTVQSRLATEVTDKKLANAITGYASKQICNDLR
jgi:hypothetical protein